MKLKQSMATLEQHKNSLTYCLQCGLCLSECPIFKSSRLSSLTSRGRMRILAGLIDGELTVSKRMAEVLDQCLLCEACANVCPSGMPVGKIMASARAVVNEKQGLPLVKKMALWTLGNQKRAGKLARFAAPFAGLVTKSEGNGRIPRSFVAKLSPLAKVPQFGSETFIEKFGGVHKPQKEIVGKVAYYVGCMTNLCYQETGKAVLNYLLEQGYQVEIPNNQECCGLPAFASGDLEEASKLAKSNWQVYQPLEVDAIIADCSSCVSMWKHHLPQMAEKDEKSLPPVYEVMGFLADQGRLPQELKKVAKLKVGYHAPCHTRGDDISRQAPKKLLKNINAQYVPLDYEEKCCGGGGSFGALHPEVMEDIQHLKMEEIKEKGIDLLVTTCPSCRMYLDAGVTRVGATARVCHPLELL